MMIKFGTDDLGETMKLGNNTTISFPMILNFGPSKGKRPLNM